MLSTLILAGCEKPQPVNLPFSLTYHNENVDCEQFPQALSKMPIQLKDFRLYLHDIQLKNSRDQWHSVKLTQNSLWQNDSTVLLDFENALGNCRLGNRGMNQIIRGTVKPGYYQAVRFKIGVPFELNHENPLLAKPPLNLGSMHWHWQGGYKFVRAEFVINNLPRRLHLGSLHCKGEVGNISHCETPNRPQFTLNNFRLNQTAIKLSLDKLLDNPELQDDSYLTCMGATEHPWCDNALKWLGLANSQDQSAFLLDRQQE